jgi:hypothetical protein
MEKRKIWNIAISKWISGRTESGEYFIGNAGKGFEASFIIEHDEAFRKILLPRAKKGLK